MQIDSVKVHELLNKIAISSNHEHIETITKIRRALCDLEAETAFNIAKSKSLEGMVMKIEGLVKC